MPARGATDSILSPSLSGRMIDMPDKVKRNMKGSQAPRIMLEDVRLLLFAGS